jgi:hypothetical protein
MNTDIRISVSFLNHRKRKRLKMLLGAGATDYLIDLWIASAMNHPDGILSGMDEVDIALEAGWEGNPNEFIEALLTCRFLEKDEKGVYFLHDWEEHQPWVVNAKARSEKARKAVNARWGKKKEKDGNKDSEENLLQAKGEEFSGDTNPILNEYSEDTQSNTPILSFPFLSSPLEPTYVESSASDPEGGGQTVAKVKPSPPRMKIPYSQIMELWNSILGSLGKPVLKELSATRKAKIKALWKDREMGDFREIATWEKFFKFCTKSELIMENCWFSFDWLLKPGNFLKVVEGNYHGGGGRKKAWQGRSQ